MAVGPEVFVGTSGTGELPHAAGIFVRMRACVCVCRVALGRSAPTRLRAPSAHTCESISTLHAQMWDNCPDPLRFQLLWSAVLRGHACPCQDGRVFCRCVWTASGQVEQGVLITSSVLGLL